MKIFEQLILYQHHLFPVLYHSTPPSSIAVTTWSVSLSISLDMVDIKSFRAGSSQLGRLCEWIRSGKWDKYKNRIYNLISDQSVRNIAARDCDLRHIRRNFREVIQQWESYEWTLRH